MKSKEIYIEKTVTEKVKKVKDTSNYEIENKLIKFPVKSKITGEILNNKKEYLSSKHWKKIKFRYDTYLRGTYKDMVKNKKCELCGKEIKTVKMGNLHHLTYANLGDEKLEDLIYLCAECHSKAHGNEYDEKAYIGEIKAKRHTMYNPNDLITFGKYKNTELKEIFKKDINYFKWLINSKTIKLSKKSKLYFWFDVDGNVR